MADEIDAYYSEVVLPSKGFNLWHYMSAERVKDWDFDKIRAELARIETGVKAVKAARV